MPHMLRSLFASSWTSLGKKSAANDLNLSPTFATWTTWMWFTHCAIPGPHQDARQAHHLLSLGNSLLLACVARLSSDLAFHVPPETVTHAVPCGLSSFSSSLSLWHSAPTLFVSVSPFFTFYRIRMQMCYKFAFLLGPIPFAVHSQCLLVCVPDA